MCRWNIKWLSMKTVLAKKQNVNGTDIAMNVGQGTPNPHNPAPVIDNFQYNLGAEK